MNLCFWKCSNLISNPSQALSSCVLFLIPPPAVPQTLHPAQKFKPVLWILNLTRESSTQLMMCYTAGENRQPWNTVMFFSYHEVPETSSGDFNVRLMTLRGFVGQSLSFYSPYRGNFISFQNGNR